jgi:glycosyltransferase involved in cell wall biosynthesis
MEYQNKQKKIKILYLTTSSIISGAEKVILTLVKDINHSLFNIEVCTLSPKGALHEELDKLKVKNYNLGLENGLYTPIAVYRLYRLLKKERYDILNTLLFHASVIGIFIGKIVKVPYIIESRHYSDLMYKYNLRLRQLLDRITSKRFNGIIAVSNAAKEVLTNYEKVDTNKITVIYNGINIDIFKFIIKQREQTRKALGIEDKIVLSYTAHLRPEKGHKYLLEAISEIKDQYTNVVLLLMGDGVLRSDLDALTRQLNIEDKVRFLGYRKDIPALLSAADIYVHTSVVEGFGIAIIEAMAIGLPVVATNVGGIPEIITNGENGILVPPENPQALAKAIVDLIEHPEKRKILAEKGKQHVKANFTYQIMVKEYMQVYNNAISKGKQHTGKN